MLTIGVITLTACNSVPTVSKPVYSCVTSQKFQVCKCGMRNLDYKTSREAVGEWVDINALETKPLDQCPDMVGISLEDWLTKVKPTLKEGSDAWYDYIEKFL